MHFMHVQALHQLHGKQAHVTESFTESSACLAARVPHLTRPDLRHSEANFRLVARSCSGGSTRPRTHSSACSSQRLSTLQC